MAYIYKITNKLNQKVYIGKTERDIETRWKEHCSHINVYPHIPLYRAIKKYGKENFTIEIIEECDAANIDNQEMYWINYYNSYQGEGYNCTGGGEGGIKPTPMEELNQIAIRYSQGERLDKLCKEFHHDYEKIRRELVEIKSITVNTQAGPMKNAKAIIAINPKTNEIVKEYVSISEASRELCKEGKNPRVVYNHIQAVLGKKNVRYGYQWALKEEE